VHRILAILLTLALAPSMATASWYRCAYDGVIRSACCCPARPAQGKKQAPAPVPSVRAACCCTVTQVTSRAPDAESKAAAAIRPDPAVCAVTSAMAAPRIARVAVAIDRPRALGDPPDTLFARRCSLLL
jgi:hypothetical protein